jgi:hypothetical protein
MAKREDANSIDNGGGAAVGTTGQKLNSIVLFVVIIIGTGGYLCYQPSNTGSSSSLAVAATIVPAIDETTPLASNEQPTSSNEQLQSESSVEQPSAELAEALVSETAPPQQEPAAVAEALPQTQPQTQPQAQPTQSEQLTTAVTQPTTKPVSSGMSTKDYTFGKYVGELKNGIPDGQGTMTYTRSVQIALHANGKSYCAEPGDVFTGLWGNGDIISGVLRDKDNNEKARPMPGKRPNAYDISNDRPCN